MEPKASEPIPKVSLNLAIVGGGRTCRFFLELLNRESFSFLQVRVVGVCDIHPDAEGYRMAQALGIPTTTNFRELFDIPELDGILELTNSQEVLLELIHLRPPRVSIVEHNIGRLLRRFFSTDQKLKSAEQQVIWERTISDFLIQQARQRILVLNTDFTIADINEAYLQSLGKSREEVVGGHCYQILHGYPAPCTSARARFDCPVLETLRTGRSARVVREGRPMAGDVNYSDIITHPVKNAEGEIVRVIEIWRDLAHELASRWEKRVRELKSNLNVLVQEDRLISLGKLVASCVHEINNPIQGLMTFSHLMQSILKGPPLTDDGLNQLKEYTALMSGELERVGGIVSGLLFFSRESPKAYRNVDLNDVLPGVLSLTRHKMELQAIRLRTDFADGMLMIHGDVNQLQQCFLNLIFNAIEAMPDGGELTVVSSRDASGPFARVEIRDTGNGIADRDLSHIFDPFFTTKNMGEGTGLGLSIVYGVVKSHEGDVKVESRKGRGTAFVMTFPLR